MRMFQADVECRTCHTSVYPRYLLSALFYSPLLIREPSQKYRQVHCEVVVVVVVKSFTLGRQKV